uniref:Uncharacterized protein n=1 Tax=Serinus canaria TaxID=9135 RepID=A0A8C9MEY3_SERCA
MVCVGIPGGSWGMLGGPGGFLGDARGSRGCQRRRCRQERLEMTETFKQQKVRLARDGCDPALVAEPLFVLDEAARAFVPLDPERWQRLRDGRIRI